MGDARSSSRAASRLRPLLLLVLALALHGARLEGPLTDGQHGNCAGMFGLFARNAETLGGLGRWVPVINPLPPADLGAAEFYTHHPPLLPWLNQAALALGPFGYVTAPRIVALLLSWWAACLAAALVARASGAAAGWIAGLAMLALPAGLHHGTLVNYETVAIPAALWLWWVLGSRTTGAAATLGAGAWAALSDWVALFPLVWSGRGGAARQRRLAATGAGIAWAGVALLFSSVSEGSLADTLAQGLAVSPLAPDFSTTAWAEAQARHLGALYGWASALLAAGAAAAWVPALGRRLGVGGDARRLLRALSAFGLANLVIFARHATGHEHYALLLLPAVAASVALVVDGVRRRLGGRVAPRPAAASAPPAAGGARLGDVLALGLLALLAVDSGRRFTAQRPDRERVTQSAQAVVFGRHFRDDVDVVHLRPDGVSFVFLFGARAQIAPFPVGSFEGAREVARTHRERFGVPPGATRIVLLPGDPLPDWLAVRPADAEAPDGFRTWTLPPR